MAEWPKEAWICDEHGLWTAANVITDCGGPSHAVQVIPADLGRELYEALRYYDEHHHPDSVLAALARYEREVGE